LPSYHSFHIDRKYRGTVLYEWNFQIEIKCRGTERDWRSRLAIFTNKGTNSFACNAPISTISTITPRSNSVYRALKHKSRASYTEFLNPRNTGKQLRAKENGALQDRNWRAVARNDDDNDDEEEEEEHVSMSDRTKYRSMYLILTDTICRRYT